MRTYKFLMALSIALCTCFAMVGCGGSWDNRYEGTYYSESRDFYDYLEVDEDGYFTLTSFENGFEYAVLEGWVDDDSGNYSNATIYYSNGSQLNGVYGKFILSGFYDDVYVSIYQNGELFSNFLYYRISYDGLKAKDGKKTETGKEKREENKSALSKEVKKD